MKRHELTASQAKVLSEIEQRRRNAIEEWTRSVTLVGLDPDKIRGGNLSDDPHFMVADEDDAPPA